MAKKVPRRSFALVVLAAAAALLAGCPLPFQYNGKGSTNAPSDPSSPNMTAAVTVTYAVQGGASGTIADGGSLVTGQTTTVTLATTSLNAVIFYTTNGLSLTNLRTAQKIDASSGSFTVTRMTTAQSLDIYAVAVGPNMLPSPPVHVTVGVSPYPILSVSRSGPSISEDGGTATFTITASSAPASDLTVSLLTGGTYAAGEVTGLQPSGTTFSTTLQALHTTVAVPITANHDANGVNETVSLTINPDPGNVTTYTPGTPATASILIQDDNTPVLTVSASPASIPDNGGVTALTVTSSFAPASDLAVSLVTSGAYKPGDVTGLPGQGGSFTLTIPAGQTTATQGVTAHPDPGDYVNQTVTVSLVAAPAYTIGSPGSTSVTLVDTSPVPVLTLTEDRSAMVDGQSATFTITASVAPDANQTVDISSSGYTPGQVVVPASVTLPAGVTSTTFQVSAPSAVGYQVENPQVSLLPGTGHTIGSPSTQGLVITDDVLGVTYDGMWGFNTDTSTGVGTGASWSLSGNVTLGSGGLTFGGVYGTPGDDAQVNLDAGGVSFDKNHFTLAVRFSTADLSTIRAIIVGGVSYRWLIVQTDTAGNLALELNNHTVHLNPGLAVTIGTTYTLVLDIDVDTLTATMWLDGTSVTMSLPSGFTWNNLTGDSNLTADDYSTGRAFKGTWDWVFAVNGLLSYSTIVTMAASSGL